MGCVWAECGLCLGYSVGCVWAMWTMALSPPVNLFVVTIVRPAFHSRPQC